MGVIDWINGIIGDATGGLARLASSVAQKIAWVYNFVVGFLASVRATVIRIRDFVRNFLGAVILVGAATYTALKWLAQVALPRAITQMFDILTAYADRAASLALSAARALIADVKTFVSRLIAALQATVSGFIRWATQNIGTLLNDVKVLVDHVFGVLGTPERLVAWIIGTLVKALFSWALDNAVALGQAFWASRTRILLSGASKIEDIITRII